jgi:hypothetical protein
MTAMSGVMPNSSASLKRRSSENRTESFREGPAPFFLRQLLMLKAVLATLAMLAMLSELSARVGSRDPAGGAGEPFDWSDDLLGPGTASPAAGEGSSHSESSVRLSSSLRSSSGGRRVPHIGQV